MEPGDGTVQRDQEEEQHVRVEEGGSEKDTEIMRNTELVDESLSLSEVSENESENSFLNGRTEVSFYDEDDDPRKNKLNFALSNARSVAAKIPSLVDMFTELNLNFLMLTETWLQQSRATEEEMERLLQGHGIGMISRSRGSRGGGVAVAFRTTDTSLKKFVVEGPNSLEILAVTGKIADFTRRFLIIVVYIPPCLLYTSDAADE